MAAASSSKGKEVILKITYGAVMRRLKYQQKEHNGLLLWSPDLSIETLHSRIEELFQIPSTDRFLVRYTDNANDLIAISNSDDVLDVIEGSLSRFRSTSYDWRDFAEGRSLTRFRSTSDDWRDLTEGRPIRYSTDPLRLEVSLMESESGSVGGAPCDQPVAKAGQLILPASKRDKQDVYRITSCGPYRTHDLEFREQLRLLSYNMLQNPRLHSSYKGSRKLKSPRFPSSPKRSRNPHRYRSECEKSDLNSDLETTDLDWNLESTTKLVKLYETTKWSSSLTQIPVDLIENLLNRIALAFPELAKLEAEID